MSLYVESSALLNVYLDQPQAEACARFLEADPVWLTARHSWVEVRRNLARWLDGSMLAAARAEFERDWDRMSVVELDAATCEVAADLAEATGVRTLDALHLGAAHVAGDGELDFLTYDRRQAEAARALGWTVLGS